MNGGAHRLNIREGEGDGCKNASCYLDQQAREDLDRALAELDQIPAFDPHIVGSVAHTLNNYASVMSATTAMLRNALPHPEPEVATWLEAIDHATVLMHHTIGRLLQVSSPPDFPLKPEFVNVPLLMERAVHYHRPTAEMKGIGLAVRTIGEVPPAWADRVAVAVIVDNLLQRTPLRDRTGAQQSASRLVLSRTR